MKKKLTCHCGGVEAVVNVPEKGFEKILRCNCSICKKKGYIIGVLGSDDFKLVKGEDLLTLYQFYTKTAQHYFCKLCGVYTHHKRRRYPDQIAVNFACLDDLVLPEDIHIGLVDGASND